MTELYSEKYIVQINLKMIDKNVTHTHTHRALMRFQRVRNLYPTEKLATNLSEIKRL